MAYSKEKLKSNGDRASPCFKPFLIGNMSDKFLPTRTLLYVSIRQIFISLTSFLGIRNSMRIERILQTEKEALDRTLSRTRFVRGCRPVVRQTTECVNELIYQGRFKRLPGPLQK
jgi:hypothetical protein